MGKCKPKEDEQESCCSHSNPENIPLSLVNTLSIFLTDIRSILELEVCESPNRRYKKESKNSCESVTTRHPTFMHRCKTGHSVYE